jgi:thioredoxin
MMATFNLKMNELEDKLEKNDIMLIDFWAEWCGPCKMFGPTYEKVSEKYPEIAFAKVDTEEEQDLAMAFGIRSIPTLAIFREKILVFKQAGMLPENALEDLLGQVKNLDMEDVRVKIAEEEAKQKKKVVA